ncbi:MAG: hypothetical protein JG765_666 [Cereibacter sp.]|jgi:hypothetical protein|nr:hypothetical protein [Cereibacter sp.]
MDSRVAHVNRALGCRSDPAVGRGRRAGRGLGCEHARNPQKVKTTATHRPPSRGGRLFRFHCPPSPKTREASAAKATRR